MSYRDCSSQIQKFAVRFPSCLDAESFVSYFKDCSRDTMDIAAPTSDFMCDSSSPSEMIASNALYKFLEGESYEEAAGGEEPDCPLPLLIKDVSTRSSGLPLSFTELLTNCSKNLENGNSMPREEGNHASITEEIGPNKSPLNVSEQLVALEEDVRNEISQYMSDASFHELIFKIEKVIHELGGDLSL